MNEITIMCGSEGFEVSLKSTELSFKELEARALALILRLQGEPSQPGGYHG